MNVRRSTTLLLTAVSLLLPRLATSDAWIPQPGEHYLEFRGAHERSIEYFDGDGTTREHPIATATEARELLSTNEIGWKKKMSLVFAAPLRSVTVRQDALRSTRTVTGLSDLTLGARYALLQGRTGLTVQIDWKAPLGYQHRLVPVRFPNAPLPERVQLEAEPRLGEGQQDVTGRLSFGTGFRSANAFLELTGGYRYRFEQPLDEIVFGADIGFWVRPSWLVEGRYGGFSSLGTGAENIITASVDDPLKRSRHAAGGSLTYRVDDHMDVFAGANLTVSGKNVGDVSRVYAGVAFKKTRLDRLQGYLGGKRTP